MILNLIATSVCVFGLFISCLLRYVPIFLNKWRRRNLQPLECPNVVRPASDLNIHILVPPTAPIDDDYDEWYEIPRLHEPIYDIVE